MLTAAGHRHGWPVAEGGSASITHALASLLESLGGTIVTGHPVSSRADLPAARVTLFDTGPGAVADILGDELPGPHPACLPPVEVRPGGLQGRPGGPRRHPLDQRGRPAGPARSTSAARSRRSPPPRLTSARAGCPSGPSSCSPSSRSPTRPGPPATSTRSGPTRTCPRGGAGRGSRSCSTRSSASHRASATTSSPPPCGTRPGSPPTTPTTSEATSRRAPTTCASSLGRPKVLGDPYATGVPGYYLCSSATPPGAGVHGMCGYRAATRALAHLRESSS